jgi:predicted acylesterase/phospholipase RssA
VIFQAAKLGDLDMLIREIDRYLGLIENAHPIGRVYGLSGGALGAAGFALSLSANRAPDRFHACQKALTEIQRFLSDARSSDIRSLNINAWYGFYNLKPLRAWLAGWMQSMQQDDSILLSKLPIPLYLCAADRDGSLTLFGPPDAQLTFQYGFVRIGPPDDAPLLDALIAALSTAISTEPAQVNGDWYRDVRPAIPDGRAIVSDLEASDPCPILCMDPHTPLPDWKLNWISSSFIMHRHHERNQSLLARCYVDLLERQRSLEKMFPNTPRSETQAGPSIHHIDLPYVGSTEALTNLRQSVAQKEHLMARFQMLLEGQFDGFDFSQEANVIYGAGGFSGILAGLVTTRIVDTGFKRGGGHVRQVYGVSAGVLNGFFHAVQLAAERHPELYPPAAQHALADLEDFMAGVAVGKVAWLNLDPKRFWQGWANLRPLRAFLLDRLSVYTGSECPEELTFDDLQLPMTVAAAREDGFTDFLGMSKPRRYMRFGGQDLEVQSAPVVTALLAGWSMNTYVEPTEWGGQRYRDGGGAFYDIGLFVACMDDDLVSLLNIHLDEPEGHSYNIPAKPSLVRVIFDTHNYTFPEERRRMRALTDLLYEHFCCRKQAAECGYEVGADFRQDWRL